MAFTRTIEPTPDSAVLASTGPATATDATKNVLAGSSEKNFVSKTNKHWYEVTDADLTSQIA